MLSNRKRDQPAPLSNAPKMSGTDAAKAVEERSEIRSWAET